MIQAKFYAKHNGSIHMTLRGHSGDAPQGQDMICAAATALAYTAAQAVQFAYEEGRLNQKPKIDIRYGEATVIATPTKEAYDEVLHIFWVVQCGMHVLSHNYPQNLRMEYIKV